MKKKKKKTSKAVPGKMTQRPDFTSPDENNDHSTNDDQNDNTVKRKLHGKSKLETNPDFTLPDTDADPTKKETERDLRPNEDEKKMNTKSKKQK